MPRRLRRPKLRTGTEAEARAWRMAFTCGHDYLRELKAFGLATDAEVSAAMGRAWKRFGVDFMAHWDSKPRHRDPHAFQKFGEPRCR